MDVDSKTDYHADTSKVPYILDEFKYYFETPFDTTDKNFAQCTLDRPKDASPDGRMYIVNHFLDIEIFPGVLIPNLAESGTTNSVASILAQTDLCYNTYKRTPNVVLVSHYLPSILFSIWQRLTCCSLTLLV